MKKIFYIGNFRAPNFNAAGKRVFGNAKLLNELNFDVICIGIGDSYIHEEYDNINFYSLVRSFNIFKSYKNIKDIINKYSINSDDIIIFYGSISFALLNFMLLRYARKYKVKTISDCPDWITDKVNNSVYDIVRKLDYNLEKRIFNKNVDGLILISNYLKSYYRKINSVVIPPLSVLNYSDISLLNDDKIHFVYAGIPFRLNSGVINSNQMKDRLDLIIDVLSKIEDKDKFIFDIYGLTQKEYLAAVPRHIDLLNSSNNIHFHGKIDNKELVNIISSADYSILFRDIKKETMAGFSTKISESISLFTPVITNNTSDISKYIKDNMNGFILNLNDTDNCTQFITDHVLNNKSKVLKMKIYCKDNQIFYYKNYVLEMRKFIEGIKNEK